MQKSLQETAARVEKIAGTPAFLTAQTLDDNRGETAIWLAGALMALCPVSGKNARVLCDMFSLMNTGFSGYGVRYIKADQETPTGRAVLLECIGGYAQHVADNKENAAALCDTVYKAFEKIINHRGGWKRCPHLDKYGVFWDVERLLAIGTALNTWDAEILESLKQEREAAEREAAERKAAELENIPWATEEDLKHLFGEDR